MSFSFPTATGATATFKGQSCEWGTGGIYTGCGICVGSSFDEQGQHDRVENTEGARTGMIFYDVDYSGSFTCVALASATPPAIGDSIAIAGVTLYVTGVKKDWGNKQKAQYTITAEGGSNIATTTPQSGGGSGG